VTLNRRPVSGQTWDGIRTEFTLPALEQVRRRLCELMEDPEPVMRQLVRVFLSGLLRLVPFQLAFVLFSRDQIGGALEIREEVLPPKLFRNSTFPRSRSMVGP
jgi:hypothetical protein